MDQRLFFTVALYEEQNKTYKLINGNVGDSRTVLAKREGTMYSTIPVTFDHKPTDEAERRRIEAAGGSVQLSRVDGQLALSRAFGDRMLKVPMASEFPRENRKVTSNPDFVEEIAKAGDFLFMACDGIYEGDIFTRESVIQWLSEKLEDLKDPAVVCAKLLDECLARGSRDNMSAMIILFENGIEYARDHEYLPGPWHNGENDHKFQDAYTADARAAGYELQDALALYNRLKEESRVKPAGTEAPKTNNTVNNNTNNYNNINNNINNNNNPANNINNSDAGSQ